MASTMAMPQGDRDLLTYGTTSVRIIPPMATTVKTPGEDVHEWHEPGHEEDTKGETKRNRVSPRNPGEAHCLLLTSFPFAWQAVQASIPFFVSFVFLFVPFVYLLPPFAVLWEWAYNEYTL